MIRTIKCLDTTYEFEFVSRQYLNGRLGISVYLPGGEPWGNLSTNLPDTDLDPDEIAVKVDAETTPWVIPVLEQMPDVFMATGKRVLVGAWEVPYDVWKVIKHIETDDEITAAKAKELGL